jgi:hypothetical protein
MVVTLHALAVLLVVLWARFISGRFQGRGILLRLFDRLVASPSKQKTENAKCATSRHYENKALKKPEKQATVR